jgi:hypothetical protein
VVEEVSYMFLQTVNDAVLQLAYLHLALDVHRPTTGRNIKTPEGFSQNERTRLMLLRGELSS